MHTEKLAHPGAITKWLLICAAIEAEVDRLRSLCESISAECMVCGVGNVAAAVSLSSRLSQERFREILFVGSCGAYGDFRGAFEAAYSREFFQKDLAVLSGRAKQPLPARAVPEAGALGSLLETHVRRRGATNCPDSVTLDLSGADISGLAFENMECYGLASAAMAYGIPFSAVFAVTNGVGPDGSAQWAKNYRAYSDLLQKELAVHLTSHAASLKCGT